MNRKIIQYIKLIIEQSEETALKMKILKSIDNIPDLYQYLELNFVRLGKGSSRIAYALDQDRVIKLAFNNAGIEQNQVEADPRLQAKYGEWIAKVYDRAEDYSWLEVDKVYPGMDYWEDASDINLYELNRTKRRIIALAKDRDRSIGEIIEEEYPDLQKDEYSLLMFLIEFGIDDLAGFNVGVTADERPVIVDYGYNPKTSEIYKGIRDKEEALSSLIIKDKLKTLSAQINGIITGYDFRNLKITKHIRAKSDRYHDIDTISIGFNINIGFDFSDNVNVAKSDLGPIRDYIYDSMKNISESDVLSVVVVGSDFFSPGANFIKIRFWTNGLDDADKSVLKEVIQILGYFNSYWDDQYEKRKKEIEGILLKQNVFK